MTKLGDIVSAEPSEVAFERLQQPVPPPEHKRRRWPWIVVPALTLVLLATTAAAVYASHHQPLATRGWSTFDGGINTIGDGVNSMTGFVVDAKPGTRGQMSLDVKNNGPFAVTLTSVGYDRSVTAQWVQPVDNEPSDRIDPSRLRSLPVTIPSGEQRTLMLSILSPADCNPGGAGDMRALKVESTWLGLAHVAYLPLPAPIYVCVPADHHYTPGNESAVIG